METTVVRGDARELVAFALFQLGYRPLESLVLLGLDGRDRTSGVVARVDLPRRAADVGPVVDLLVSGATGRAVTRGGRVFALVLSDAFDAGRDGGPGAQGGHGTAPLAHAETVRRLRRRLRRAGVALVDALAVGRDVYWSYLCDDDGCCPRAGRPLGDLRTTRTAAHMVLGGRTVADDERALVRDVEPEAEAGGGAEPDAGSPDLARWRRVLADGSATAADLAWLGAALEAGLFRDAVLLTLVPGSGEAPEQLLAGGGDDLARGLLARRPDDDLLERGRAVLAAVARTAPPGRRAQALSMLAWSAWWDGQGTRARLLAARALDDSPGHRLATLVDALLSAGVAPEWVHADQPHGETG